MIMVWLCLYGFKVSCLVGLKFLVCSFFIFRANIVFGAAVESMYDVLMEIIKLLFCFKKYCVFKLMM